MSALRSARATHDAREDAPRPSLEALYAEHVSFVWRTLRRLGVPEAVREDATQDVFVVVHRLLPSFEHRSAVRTWLYSIVRKVARDHRRRARRAMGAEEAEAQVSGAPSPEQLAGDAEAAGQLQRMLDGLSEERREAFVLVDLEEMSVVEAAEATGVNLNTMYARVRSARLELEQALRRERARARGPTP